MLIKDKAIVLAVIKYNDNDAIVKCFTRETGFTSYFIKSLRNAKKGKLKKAFFQANNILNIVTTNKAKGQLEYIKEAQPAYHYKSLFLDFDKISISTFMREILLQSLKNERADTQLFHFIEQEFIQLDQNNFNPDTHIFFLLKLSQFLGFSPQTNTQGTYFDMENGIFSQKMPLGSFLNQAESNLLKRLLGTIFDTNKSIKLSNNDRRTSIDFLLKYYQLHLENFALPKSLPILNQIYR